MRTPTEILLERESVLTQLGELAQRAGRGAGQVVLLRGEAGVGKTAVIRRFLAGLDERVQVLRGSCDPLATPRPLGPLIDMLAELRGPQAGELAAAIDRGDAEAVYANLLALFTDGNTWVCAVEDVQWVDGATLDLLRFLARRVASLPVLLLVSYRDDEVGTQHPLAVALGDVATYEALTRIGLTRLSRDAVAVLAAGSVLNADELHRLTGGNPFFCHRDPSRRPGCVGRQRATAQRFRGGAGQAGPAVGARARRRPRSGDLRPTRRCAAAGTGVPGRGGGAG
jgi:predicted ATPase